MVELDRIICGDCLDVLKTLPEDSVDAIVTDPPAGIAFMGKEWDQDKGGRDEWIGWMAQVASECLRVIKPGGHALVWALPRTSHWTGMAWEEAGWEPRDKISHVFGSGFPKSLDISKALDKMAGAEREVVGHSQYEGRRPTAFGGKKNGDNAYGDYNAQPEMLITAPATPAAKQWAGFGTALKPAHEDWWLFRKPLEEATIAANVLKWGCGGLNIDGCRIGTDERLSFGSREIGDGVKYSPMPKDKQTPGIQNNLGRFPSNLIWSHSLLCKRIGTKKIKPLEGHRPNPVGKQSDGNIKFTQKEVGFQKVSYTGSDGLEEVESWDCAPDCPSWEFAKAGERASGGSMHERSLARGTIPLNGSPVSQRNNTLGPSEGSAARFFQACPFTDEDLIPFIYQSKASRSERGEGNNHPTVKSLSLMRYLCRLITPPGGLILDPFAGSGTTCLAAKQEGFHFLGIEKEPEYAEIARRRIAAIPTSLSRWAEDARP